MTNRNSLRILTASLLLGGVLLIAPSASADTTVSASASANVTTNQPETDFVLQLMIFLGLVPPDPCRTACNGGGGTTP